MQSEVPLDLESLDEEAARLPPEQQHALLDRIVDRLTTKAEDDIARAWDAEIARRVDELDRGGVTPIPWEEVQRRLHARRRRS